VVSPEPVLPLGETVTGPVGALEVGSFGRTVVAEGLAPGVALAGEPRAVPAAGVDPDELEPPGWAGVVPAGLGVVAGGFVDELGLGAGFGCGWAVAAGGALLGAPPDPKANPMTLPLGGS
jgi:hypothetical protein